MMSGTSKLEQEADERFRTPEEKNFKQREKPITETLEGTFEVLMELSGEESRIRGIYFFNLVITVQ